MKMKKVMACVLALALCCGAVVGLAEEADFSGFTDEALTALYNYVKAEMDRRGLNGSQSYELPEGKYIIGQDIQPGSYTLTCVKTVGESIGDAYSSLGSLFGVLGDDEADYGSFFGSFGGMMGDLVGTTVEVIGDYGTVIKSYTLKAGETVKITLEGDTALRIEGGECKIEK